MKKTQPRVSPKKLTIDKDRLRVLPEDDLATVAGGDGERRGRYRKGKY